MLQLKESPLDCRPLFFVRYKSTGKLLLVIDFVKGMETYLLVCKPYPCPADTKRVSQKEMNEYCKEYLFEDEVFAPIECTFLGILEYLDHREIARIIDERRITIEDLRIIDFPEQDLKLINIFLDKQSK